MFFDGWFCLVFGAALLYLTIRQEPKVPPRHMTLAWQLYIGAIFVQAAAMFLLMIFTLCSSPNGITAIKYIASSGTLAMIAMSLLSLVRGVYPPGGSPEQKSS